MRLRKKHLYLLAGLAILVISAPLVVWWLMPFFAGDVLAEMRQHQTPVREYYDASGNLLWLERTYNYQWRFQLQPEEIPEVVKNALLATEDSRFYLHHGVDYQAAFRAFSQLARNRKIISGASTITMQLAGLGDPPHRRSWAAKFRQIARARKMEKLYDKETILTEYINRIPFGGKIFGIEAAARYYFGKHACELTLLEATLLCGIPQRPEKLRPDRHPQEAMKRQATVLRLLERHGYLQHDDKIKIQEEAFRRSHIFKEHAPFAGFSDPGDARMYLTLAAAERPDKEIFHTVYQAEKQEIIINTLKQQCASLRGIRDGAAVLIDNKTCRIIALVGTLDFSSPQAGQVNAATANRVAGSVLKPFIYAEAINGGLYCADSFLDDSPQRFASFQPENFTRTFRGRVTATEALSSSLNLPAIKLVAELGLPRTEQVLRRCGLLPPVEQRREKYSGLTLALGTAGHNLLDLTIAYSVLVHGGVLRRGSFLQDSEETASKSEETTIFNPGTAAMVSQMLYARQLPGTVLQVAWKTGTSNGFHDAWCIAYTPDYTLGVWLGNKTGEASPDLIGGTAAAPCAGAIFEALYRDTRPSDWPNLQKLALAELCAQSGLRPNQYCTDKIQGLVIADIPLRRCRTCNPNATVKLKIISPKPTTYLLTKQDTVTLPLETSPRQKLNWLIDGKFYPAETAPAKFSFAKGSHSISAFSDTVSSQTVYFLVE